MCLAVEQQDFVCDWDQRLIVVCHNDAGAVVTVMRVADQFGHLRAAGCIEPGGWFVVQDNVGIGSQRACNRQSLFLTPTEGSHGGPGRNAKFFQPLSRRVARRGRAIGAVVDGKLHVRSR